MEIREDQKQQHRDESRNNYHADGNAVHMASEEFLLGTIIDFKERRYLNAFIVR
jgi:hypothetical protein